MRSLHGHTPENPQPLSVIDNAARPPWAGLPARARAPGTGEAWFCLGVVCCGRHMIAESLAAHRQAVRAEPENAFYWYALGTMYRTFQPMRWRGEAKKAFREALRHDEDYAEARAALDVIRPASLLRRILGLVHRARPLHRRQ